MKAKRISRKLWFWIIGVVVLSIAGLLVGGLGMLGRLPWQRGNLYKDPQGRFTMEVDPSWIQVATDGWIGKDDFGKFYFHRGGGVSIETSMRYYPDMDLGVVVMGSVNGYQADAIAESLVSAWMNEK